MTTRRIDTSFESWHQEWMALGVTTPGIDVYHSIVASYQESHRAYHTLQHLEECFSLLTDVGGQSAEISLALWFHDSIYDTKRTDNEARSAEWLAQVALTAGASRKTADSLHALVMVTCHVAVPDSLDEQVLVDIDLAILGAPEARFAEYERQVRREYEWVPDSMYRQKRAALLKEFLDRPALYSTPRFRDLFEDSARRNILRSLKSLAASPSARSI